MLSKTFVLAALSVGFVAAFCPPCQQTSQRDAFNKADVVAHIKVNNVQGGGLSGTPALGTSLGGGQGASASLNTRRQMTNTIAAPAGGASVTTPTQEPVTYQVQYIKTFKPKAGNPQAGEITSSGDVTCSGVRMIQGQEYLIAGKRNGSRVEITKCGGIPLTENGFANGPISWTIAQNTLAQQLESGFQGGSSTGGLGAGAKLGGQGGQGASATIGERRRPQGGASAPQGVQQPDQQSSSSQQGQDSQQFGGQQGQDSQSQQGGSQSGQQFGQDSQQFGQDSQSSQQGGDQQAQQAQQQAQQAQQQASQAQQTAQQAQGGDDQSQQGQDSQSQQGGDDQSQQGQDSQQQGQDQQMQQPQMRRRSDWPRRR